jgi:hypothetical protein
MVTCFKTLATQYIESKKILWVDTSYFVKYFLTAY